MLSALVSLTCLGAMSRAAARVHHGVPPERIHKIVSEKYKDEIDEGTAETISELIDDMIDSIVDWTVTVSKSKGSNVLEAEDVRFIAQQEWGVSVKK